MSASFQGGAGVAITGRAILAPLADSPGALHAALLEGRASIAPSAQLGGALVSLHEGFDHAKYATIRGMRMYNRATRMAICAAKLAQDDAKLVTGAPAPTYPGEEIGLLMASTYGHMDVLCEYDRSLVTSGIQRTNGALGPFAIPSAPGAMVALSFGLKAFSTSMSDGGASSLDAMGIAAQWLADGRAKACIVVATFAPVADLVLSEARAGRLARAGGMRVFDPASSGTALGEAALAFVLEREDAALARGAEVLGYVRGYGTAFAAKKASGLAGAIQRATTDALRGAGAPASEVALVSSGGSGVAATDRAELDGLAAALGERSSPVLVTSAKGAVGETVDAAGAVQVLVALSSLLAGTAPGIARLGDAAAPSSLDLARAPSAVEGGTALVTASSVSGSASAIVLSKRRGAERDAERPAPEVTPA